VSSAAKASSYRDKLFVYGCVDPGNTPVPSLDSVKRKIARALELERLDLTRVLLAPDCGLMTISRALARDKLKVMVEAARALRG
jgi:5-methyltetrahydropteroyltriglutamate--homocysteine methyltransferase